MGIESDKLVLDYLSRVGDLAQQRQLPSGDRMRLVTELRGEIDRRRASSADSPAAVRRILSRLGSPEDVVTGVGTGTDSGSDTGAESGPFPSAPVASAEATGSVSVPRPRLAKESPAAEPAVSREPSPPHLASTEELGSDARTDWWRVQSSPFAETETTGVPGFVGGVEIPELLKPPPVPPPVEKDGAAKAPDPGKVPAAKAGTEVVVEKAVAEPKKSRRLRGVPPGGWSNPLLLLAAVLLVAGAVMGNLLPLALGWIIAWASRRLTPAESKWAVVILPGLALAAGAAWLWGRSTGRWGEPIAQGQMSDAIAATWPWVLRGAAALSALYLVWRSQRRS